MWINWVEYRDRPRFFVVRIGLWSAPELTGLEAHGVKYRCEIQDLEVVGVELSTLALVTFKSFIIASIEVDSGSGLP